MLEASDGPVKYPEVTAELIGGDGNAFAILGGVSKALRQAGATPEQIAEFRTEAMAGDYDHLLATAMAFVNVE